MVEKLVQFAKANYPEFKDIPLETLQRWFEVYKHNTLIDKDNSGQLCGFAVYQDFGDFINVVAVCHTGKSNAQWLLQIARRQFDKPVWWFDEKAMKGRRF